MPKLLVKPRTPDADGEVLSVSPESAGWRHVGFKVFKLTTGQTLARETGDQEVCLVLVTGKADIEAGGQNFADLGERMSVFEGKAPSSVYVPNGERYSVTARTEVELAVCSAPGAGTHPVRLIAPEDVGFEERGRGTNRRLIYNILPETEPADSLLVVEVITPNGNWSSYPPHKHDTDNIPTESSLEETYYHHLNPPQGFAFQRVYTDDRSIDETMAVEDGNCVMVPRGYHPVGAPHGYDLYYLNVMAGPVRQWHFKNDPAHDWIMKK
ncbi:5-deoxy-glucuronate isomerase [Pelagibius sp.]|uniref:5-deoxy-glucuronate isomerase n=1 Tax=Pelagibius sp. TaxID=1931238 RepID=UPI003B50EB08